MTAVPPNPIWEDDVSGMAVWVNGGLIEITVGGEFTRVTAEEAAAMPPAFAAAIQEACSWAARWNGAGRTYMEPAS